MTLVQRCIPHAVVAVSILLIFTGKISDNWMVMLAQLYAYLILCVHGPFLIVVATWSFLKWQSAVIEQRRAEAAMAQQRRPRVFTSLCFINGAVLFGCGWALAVFLLRVFPPDARLAFAELLSLIAQVDFWAVIVVPILWICELLIGIGLVLMLIPIGRWGWHETRRRLSDERSALRDMQP